MNKVKIVIGIVLYTIFVIVLSLLTYLYVASEKEAAENAQWFGRSLLSNDLGWVADGDDHYYYDRLGNRLTGPQVINQQVYHFSADGVWDANEPVDATILYVKAEESDEINYSLTGGVGWLADAEPAFYLTMDATTYPSTTRDVEVIISNNSSVEIFTGLAFTLQRWDGEQWGANVTDGVTFPEEAYSIQPGETGAFAVDFGDLSIESGRYLLTKQVLADNEEGQHTGYRLGVEFFVFD
ncbi:hypothetical protein SAMN04488134_11634 [Amphibacillus marinus]|uniref:Bacterial Ig-like domain-containing protein n=1 Tax=Amphibacillus marinus TaxID=872970 RepID=A0A1H8TGW3_9BACI|nr:immunoglobulin-like domain-containing protein [Amphibacillus marinus]SEO90036.1 hypothetical protein SAMN04488134_11634 [Amphibacillus marinus]